MVSFKLSNIEWWYAKGQLISKCPERARAEIIKKNVGILVQTMIS